MLNRRPCGMKECDHKVCNDYEIAVQNGAKVIAAEIDKRILDKIKKDMKL